MTSNRAMPDRSRARRQEYVFVLEHRGAWEESIGSLYLRKISRKIYASGIRIVECIEYSGRYHPVFGLDDVVQLNNKFESWGGSGLRKLEIDEFQQLEMPRYIREGVSMRDYERYGNSEEMRFFHSERRPFDRDTPIPAQT